MLFPFLSFACLTFDRNISKSIFYSGLVVEFLKTARTSLLYKDFHGKVMELLNRMKAQGAQFLMCRKELSKIIRRHEKAFINFGRNNK